MKIVPEMLYKPEGLDMISVEIKTETQFYPQS